MNVNDLWIDLTLRLQSLTWVDWLDLLLVAAVFFALVTALQRTQATFMLRGLTIISLILVPVALLLPLPTFGLLVRIILLFLLITVPIVFQRELRRLLESVGRSIGLTGSTRRETEVLLQPLVRAVELMAANHVGALIVLEGEMDLDEVVHTGVPIGGSVSSELLGAIFYSNNPLHDGAALIRGETIMAAGCVLPITSRNLDGPRLGTRHRAALSLSERTDALIVVVSEETGAISAAEAGQLQRLPDQSALRERILRFAHRTAYVSKPKPWHRSLYNPDTGQLRSGFVRRLRRVLTRVGLAFLFAVILWWFVLANSRTLPDTEVRGVPLLIEEQPPGMTIANELPETVDLIVRTVADSAPILDEGAFMASVSLDGLPEGVHELAVEVTPRVDAPLRLIRIEPASIPVNLATIASRTLPISVTLQDEALLPALYEVQEAPQVEPTMAQVVGPTPLVEQVTEIRATLSLSTTRGPVDTMQPLFALDENGREVREVSLRPTHANVRLNVARRPNMREVGVAIVTQGEPAPGFWVSGLTAQPPSVVLNGAEAPLAGDSNAIATLPVDISGAAGDLSVDVPLDLPPRMTAQTLAGDSLSSVRVTVRISAHQGNLSLTRPVELSNPATATNLVVTPEEVEVILSGPLVTLQEIEENPDLVRVLLEEVEVSASESSEQTPRVVVPEGVRAQLIPAQVTVSRR